MAELSAGVLDVETIENLHAMRVATRRLRAALEVFEPCFPKREFKPALREVKELADALGERRDRDVAISSLHAFAGRIAGSDRPGVESLIGRLRAEQEEANEALAPLIDRERLDALDERLARLANGAAALGEGSNGDRPG
jgi:CHAD domain-containing protein